VFKSSVNFEIKDRTMDNVPNCDSFVASNDENFWNCSHIISELCARISWILANSGRLYIY
jgi:hypothetical protein